MHCAVYLMGNVINGCVPSRVQVPDDARVLSIK